MYSGCMLSFAGILLPFETFLSECISISICINISRAISVSRILDRCRYSPSTVLCTMIIKAKHYSLHLTGSNLHAILGCPQLRTIRIILKTYFCKPRYPDCFTLWTGHSLYNVNQILGENSPQTRNRVSRSELFKRISSY